MKSIDYSLYLVTNNKDEKEFLNIIEESIKGGVSLVQIREKSSSTKDFYELSLKVKAITSKYNVPLIINDRLDVALAINAEGVHVGQDDMPCSKVRQIIGPDKIIGVSASTIEEAQKAEKDGADYIGSGALFNTSSKDDAPKITKNDLKNITKSISIPVVAIGGITLDNIKEFKDTGIKGISVVSAIMNSDNPKLSAIELKNEFNKIIKVDFY
ncbi:thiamine phosphate synthase [Methanobrevibacter sp. OttesenSCG-928-I08]|nr:thiamine phosphate synthase [Methanobrevibacter sp. OttesenSCG-928-I08]